MTKEKMKEYVDIWNAISLLSEEEIIDRDTRREYKCNLLYRIIGHMATEITAEEQDGN